MKIGPVLERHQTYNPRKVGKSRLLGWVLKCPMALCPVKWRVLKWWPCIFFSV